MFSFFGKYSMMSEKDKVEGSNNYGSEKITVLEGLEAVRKRPAMYIGSTSKQGLHHLVYEVVDNSVDEAMAGYCKHIIVLINKDGSVTVTDDGRGIPTDMHPIYKRPALEIVVTKLHAGGKFDKGSYAVSGGLHGVGISVVAALSVHMSAIVKRNGKKYQQEYEKGKPLYDVKVIGSCEKEDTGTEINFTPDSTIFSSTKFDFSVLQTRLREIAFLNKGLKITLESEIENKKEIFFYEGGLIEFVKWLNKSKEPIHMKPVYYTKEDSGVSVEVSVQYNSGYQENVLGFVNTINTVEGGTHVVGFKTALTRAINDYAKKNNMAKEGGLTGDDVREGLTAIISVKVPEPQFEGQTKTKLGNSEVKGIVESLSYSSLVEFFEENPPIAKRIVSKAMEAQKARDAARKAKELVRRKSAFSLGGLPGKLADCSKGKAEETELYIVEGDSAGGCFAGNVEVALADGRSLSFEKLFEEDKDGKNNFCYTIEDNGSIGMSKIKNVRITKKDAEVIKIILDNNQEIVCTPDHKFMLRNGSYKQAKDLTKDDSLMPLYKRISDNPPLLIEVSNNLNHKIKGIGFLKNKVDVYDLEVPGTHNFALSSGVFVHNSAKQARNREYQVILPLKGKPLNVEKANPVKVLSNEEIANIITAVGTGVGEHFDASKLRYEKIIIMTDADVDGAHIRTLLLTFFFRFMRPLIDNGNIYIAVSPLYRIRKKSYHYVFSDEELKKVIERLGGNVLVQRFKGLGEMDAEQLWENTMDPKKRILKKVTVEDAALADEVFSRLMGDDVEARRQFIAERAAEADIDV